MINQTKRKLLARHLRHLAIGLISNGEFETRISEDVTGGFLPESYFRRAVHNHQDDRAVAEILLHIWQTFYHDHRNYRLKGRKALGPEQRKEAARIILFLRTNLEYTWQDPEPFNFNYNIIKAILTFGKFFRDQRAKEQSYYQAFYETQGDTEFWPFLKREDFISAAKNRKHALIATEWH